MGCTIFPILFVLAMEVILRVAEGVASPTDLSSGCYMPPLKAFMDDTAVLCSREKRDPQNASSFRCSNELEQKFQAEAVSKSVHKKRQILPCTVKSEAETPPKVNSQRAQGRKSWTMTMLEASEDRTGRVRTIQPHLRTGRKWNVDEAFNQAKEGLKRKEARALVFTPEGEIKSCCGGAASMDTQRKSFLDGCDDWKFSADLPEWNKHPKVIIETGMRSDFVFYSSATQQIISVELTIPYEARTEEANTYKRKKNTRTKARSWKKLDTNPRYCL
ncbi:reverse transcriptase [Plakobranchus ocellatus]|uniref:Reverse transcriptase n=1 Tax=Plakobranchus ocellatus TaxID=259542 RepID=A0AAV4DMM5_9GAST|nr:reverse transcriptase [Plakobranchus ocellatus]